MADKTVLLGVITELGTDIGNGVLKRKIADKDKGESLLGQCLEM